MHAAQTIGAETAVGGGAAWVLLGSAGATLVWPRAPTQKQMANNPARIVKKIFISGFDFDFGMRC
jgi:hypothetical protein